MGKGLGAADGLLSCIVKLVYVSLNSRSGRRAQYSSQSCTPRWALPVHLLMQNWSIIGLHQQVPAPVYPGRHRPQTSFFLSGPYTSSQRWEAREVPPRAGIPAGLDRVVAVLPGGAGVLAYGL